MLRPPCILAGCFVLGAALASPAAGGILRVPADFTEITNALQASAPGDTIQLVGNGGATYHERLTVDRDITIQGGWRADFLVRDPEIYVSVIKDPEISNEARRAVVRVVGSHRVVLDGVTLFGGQFGVQAEDGAAIEIRNSDLRGQRNGVRSGPAAGKEGGALRIVGGSLLMERCTIRDSRTGYAGAAGALVGVRSAVLRDCVVTDTNAFPFIFGIVGQVPGGAFYVVDTENFRLARTEIRQCNAFAEGGMLYIERSSATIVDCTLFGSSQADRGGAILLRDCPKVELRGLNDETSIEFATAQEGGAIYAENVDSLLLHRCRLENNGVSDIGEGGALWLDHTSFTIEQSVFANNTFNFSGVPPASGGAVRAVASTGLVSGSTFRGNVVASRGAAWYQLGGDVTFSGCVFEENESRVFGGGVHLQLSGTVLLDQCLFLRNAAKFGGGASASFTANLRVDRCTFAENRASSGAAIYVDTSASAEIVDSILCCSPRGSLVYCSQADISVSYCDLWNDPNTNPREVVEGTCPSPVGQDGNIGRNPRFCDPPGATYLLSSVSPCIGAASDGGNMGWALAGCSEAHPVSLRPASLGAIKGRYRTHSP